MPIGGHGGTSLTSFLHSIMVHVLALLQFVVVDTVLSLCVRRRISRPNECDAVVARS